MSTSRSYKPLASIGLVACALLPVFTTPARAQAATPAWNVESLALPTNFDPGDEGHRYYYRIEATDITGAPLNANPMTITDTLPKGLNVKALELRPMIE